MSDSTDQLAEGLTPAPLPGDEPEPLEVIHWPLDDLDGLLARDDLTEARSIAALFLARARMDGLARDHRER